MMSKRSMQRRMGAALGVGVLIVVLVGASVATAFMRGPIAPEDSENSYLPVLFSPPPTPTPAPIPQVVGSADLEGALCPQFVHVNPTTGYAYVANVVSDSVTVLKDGAFIHTVANAGNPSASGRQPSHIVSRDNSALTYVTVNKATLDTSPENTLGTIEQFDGIGRINAVPGIHEPFSLAYNRFNDAIYVVHNPNSEIGPLGVYDAETMQEIGRVTLRNPEGGIAGELRDVLVNPLNGEVYVTHFQGGHVLIVQGLEQVATVETGLGPSSMALDTRRGYLYVGNTNPYNDNPSITVIDINSRQVVAQLNTAPATEYLVYNPRNGYVYAVHRNFIFDEDDNIIGETDGVVAIVDGTTVLGAVDVDVMPWMATVDASGYVFVPNRESDTVTVIQDTQVVATLPTGDEPQWIAVDPLSNLKYVVNRTSHFEWDPPAQHYDEVCDPEATVTLIR